MRSRAGATKTTKVTKGHEEFLLPIARPERQGDVRIVDLGSLTRAADSLVYSSSTSVILKPPTLHLVDFDTA